LAADVHLSGPAAAERLVRAANDPTAEAVFLSCTGFATFGLVQTLEAAVGKPVLAGAARQR